MSVTRSLLLAVLVLGVAVPATATAAPPPTIAVGSNPIDIAMSLPRATAFVADDGGISFVDLNTNMQTVETSTGVHHDQTAIGVTRNGATAYTGTFDLNYLVVTNTLTQKVTGHVVVGKGAAGIVATGGHVYTALLTPDKIAVVNVSNGRLAKRITVEQSPQDLAVAPGGRFIWVGSADSGLMWVVDVRTNKVVRRVRALNGGPVSGIAFSHDGKQVWVSGLGGVTELDRSTGKVIGFIGALKAFPGNPGPNIGPLALNPSGTEVLVLDSTFPEAPAAGTVSVINTATLAVGQQITVGTEPTDIAVDPANGTTYTANFQDDTLSFFPTPN